VALCILLAPLLGLLYAKTQVAKWLAALAEALGIDLKWQYVQLALLTVALVLLFFAIFRVQRWTLPRCPHCNKSITPSEIGIVIATKNCPKCGEQVIAPET
jgi:predicted RNA-binding Zn-ribbon protein involved in translation (DUF1610 family)